MVMPLLIEKYNFCLPI